MDGRSLYLEWRSSQSSGDYANTYREGTRMAGGWSGMLVGGAAGAQVGAIICTPAGPIGPPVCAFIFGAIGSFAGYRRGSRVAADTFDVLNSSKATFFQRPRPAEIIQKDAPSMMQFNTFK